VNAKGDKNEKGEVQDIDSVFGGGIDRLYSWSRVLRLEDEVLYDGL
jgi:hypothetical protein